MENEEKKKIRKKEPDQVKSMQQEIIVSECFHFIFFFFSPSSNYTMASFSLFILKVFYNCFRESILREKEEILNEEIGIGNQILDDVNKKLQNALQNKDLTFYL